MTRSPTRLPLLGLIVSITALMTTAALAQTLSSPDAAKNDAAVSKAIAYLLTKQNSDGSIHESPKNETAMTSLSIMAMASAGHLPSDTTGEGIAVRRALAFVLRDDRQTPAGYFGQADGSRMYGHGITTLMLTEMLGMGGDAQQDEMIRVRCQKAIDLIVRAQHAKKRDRVYEGGWRYLPTDTDADLSVTVWQIVALRSAKNAGLDVPDATIDAALAYVRRSFILDQGPRPGFSYQPPARVPTATMDAAGLLAMQLCGQAAATESVEAVPWLYALPDARQVFFYYGCYYQTQSLHQHGSENDTRMVRLIDSILREQQTPGGAFIPKNPAERDPGSVYATAMAIMALSVNDHYLPIYQK